MELNSKFHCITTIHMDPVNLNCEVTNKLKSEISNILKDIDSSLSFHDFRTVSGPTHTNLIFDVVMPYNFKISAENLKKTIKEKISEVDENYFCVINIDKKFVNTKE